MMSGNYSNYPTKFLSFLFTTQKQKHEQELGSDQIAHLVKLNRLPRYNQGRRSYHHHTRTPAKQQAANPANGVGQHENYFKEIASLFGKVSLTSKNAQQNGSNPMLILSQLNLTNGNTRNNNGLDLALAAALANAQQQLNPDSGQANAKEDGSLALLNSSAENKMFNLLENSEEINDKMLKLSNYLDALKNGNSKAEGDEEIVVDNESMDDETIAEDEEMIDEEENGEEEERMDEKENVTVKGDEPDDQETDEESPTGPPDDERPEQTKPEKRKSTASKETATKEPITGQPDDDEAPAEQPKENGTKKEDALDSTAESSTESLAEEQRFKRRTRSSSLDHQNGTSGKYANERYYETDEEETVGGRQIELRKKGRRGRQSNNGTAAHLGSVCSKAAKKTEQHKSTRNEEKEVS